MNIQRDEAIARSLLRQRIARAADKTNSRTPDSLGDRLVRMSLRLSWELSHPNSVTPQKEMFDEAKALINVFESINALRLQTNACT